MSSQGVLSIGDIVTAAIPERVPSGHEQEGLRPAVVVPELLGRPRFDMVLVAPLTTDRQESWSRSPL